MSFGILNVNKPPHTSSRRVVDLVERHTRPAKCGHAGTLDPLASGVLVICVGPATRLIPYVQRQLKSYRATFLLGRTSPTDDTEGDITLLEGASEPTDVQVAAALPRFVGLIEQRPPAYSAVKVGGQRAYALARRGQAVELAPRTVTIHRLVIRRFAYPELELDIDCGSGTYIRSLGRDLAAALSTGAVMSALQRTAIGGFRVDNAIHADELSRETLAQHLLPPLAAVPDLPKVILNDQQLEEIRHGRPIGLTAVNALPVDPMEAAGVDSDNQLAAILHQKRAGEWWPKLNLIH
jgi:tRNA pseudouridine55 synthase